MGFKVKNATVDAQGLRDSLRSLSDGEFQQYLDKIAEQPAINSQVLAINMAEINRRSAQKLINRG